MADCWSLYERAIQRSQEIGNLHSALFVVLGALVAELPSDLCAPEQQAARAALDKSRQYFARLERDTAPLRAALSLAKGEG